MTLSVAALGAARVLADTTPDGPENLKASALGLAVILALCVACFFLFRSMSRHLKKVRHGFPVDKPRDGAPPPAGARADQPRSRPVPPGKGRAAP